MVSQAPKKLNPPFLLLQVFSLPTWGCLILVAVFGSVALYSVQTVHARWSSVYGITSLSNEPYRLKDAVIIVFRTLVMQSNRGDRQWPSATAGRVLATCMLLMMVCEYAFYQGTITAFLTIPRRSVPIDSLDDLLGRLNEFTPTVRINTDFWIFLKDIPKYVPIYNKVQQRAGEFLNSKSYLNEVAEGKYILLVPQTIGQGRITNMERRGVPCRLWITRQPLRFDMGAMMYRHNSVFRTPIDSAIRRLKYAGVLNHIWGKFFKKDCEPSAAVSDQTPLRMQQVQSAFYLLMGGLCMSVVALLAELAVSMRLRG